LHVALHGCLQSTETLHDVFYKHVGLNEWADSNDIVVLYPQAHTVLPEDFSTRRLTDVFESNPEGCWNWFGYGYDEHYLLRDGVQVRAIYGMVERIMGQD
jgi:poly(3-hydroxybutyrate) depolymerase